MESKECRDLQEECTLQVTFSHSHAVAVLLLTSLPTSGRAPSVGHALTKTRLWQTKKGWLGLMSFLTLHFVYQYVCEMASKWLKQQLEVYIKTEIMTAVSCSVPTVTSNILKCWLAIWYCFPSLSIKLIDLPSLSVACGWSSRFTVWAYNMNIVQWNDYSIWSLCACSCGPSSYAFTDCTRDWAVYVRDALEEMRSDLSEGICNWVTTKDSQTYRQDHIHCMSTWIVFTEKYCMIRTQAKWLKCWFLPR